MAAAASSVRSSWTTPGQTIVGDDCDFFVDEALAFEITIDGSTVIMQDADPQSSLEASTDNYSPEQNEVLLTGTTTNDDFPPASSSSRTPFSSC